MTAAADPRVVMLGAEWFDDLPGGLNRYLANLAAALAAAGIPVDAIVIGPGRDAPTYVAAAATREASFSRRVLAMRRAARSKQAVADVVDAHFAPYALLPLLTTRLRALPLVVHFQGPWADESAVDRGQPRSVLALKRGIERAVYRRADRIVVLSDAFAAVLADRYDVSGSRVTVLPPGVDLKRFTVGDRTMARTQLGLATEGFVAVAARRLEPRMGLDVLLTAWAGVQIKLPGATLLLIGEGPERRHLDEHRQALPDPDGVQFLGAVTDVDLLRAYQAADCSVVPSRALEGFGLVVLESLACGTPAIVTDVGGLPEAVAELDDSLVVPAQDPDALAIRLLAAAAGEAPDSSACRSHAERFNWFDVTRRHIELYREVVGVAARRVRVVFIDHCAQLSGGELALARLLPALDVDAHVILAEDGPLVEVLRAAGARVEVLPMAEAARGLHRHEVRPRAGTAAAALSTAAYSVRLARRLRQLRPDVVHTNSLKAAFYGGVASRLARIPVVWHIRDRIEDDYLSSIGTRLTRAAARVLPSAVIANSAMTLATLTLPPTAIGHAVPSPITGPPSPTERTSAGKPFRVGMVGRLAPWKGQHIFIDAFARAFAGGDEVAVVVGGPLFGEDDYEAQLREQVRQLGLVDRVAFRGHVTDVAIEYANLDVAVHASITPEPFGQVVIESLAHGVPVIAADAGGPAEVITDGVNGLLFPPCDVDALAERLRTLARDASLRERLADAGRRRATEFSPEAVAARIRAVYDEVMR